MKLLITGLVLGFVVAAFGEEVPVSEEGVIEEKDASDKRFSNDNGQFSSYKGQEGDLVDWNTAFHKRFSNFGDDGKLMDWSKMFKRFGDLNGQFGQNNDDRYVKWNSAFSKRFASNKGALLGNDGKMVDWSSMYKRFGTDAENPTLVDWTGMFQKNKRSKRSTSGFKRFRSGDMGFVPDPLKSGDFIDWSRVFAKRGFGGHDGALGGPSRDYSMQDWRNLKAKRNFGGQSAGYFGHDGLNDYNLENWNSLLDRKRRNAPVSDEH